MAFGASSGRFLPPVPTLNIPDVFLSISFLTNIAILSTRSPLVFTFHTSRYGNGLGLCKSLHIRAVLFVDKMCSSARSLLFAYQVLSGIGLSSSLGIPVLLA